MPLPPWVIQELEEERLKREEDERVRSRRIELPQTPALEQAPEPRSTISTVHILDISPRESNTIEI